MKIREYIKQSTLHLYFSEYQQLFKTVSFLNNN
jgi:hypothetical protein